MRLDPELADFLRRVINEVADTVQEVADYLSCASLRVLAEEAHEAGLNVAPGGYYVKVAGENRGRVVWVVEATPSFICFHYPVVKPENGFVTVKDLVLTREFVRQYRRVDVPQGSVAASPQQPNKEK